MSYNDLKDAIGRTPVYYVVITQDLCSRTFGSSPCLATGTKCYNTFATCKYLTAYDKTTRDYKFSSHGAPLPAKAGERPYIKSIRFIPAEIKSSLPVTERVNIALYDEPDTDVGIDPYVSTRSSVQGTFWKKWLARNPNYKGRKIEVYQGFNGLAIGDFALRFSGLMENISINRDGAINIECVDKLAKLKEVTIPAACTASVKFYVSGATIAINETLAADVENIPAGGGYIRIGDQIVKYTTFAWYPSVAYAPGYYAFTGLTFGQFDTTYVQPAAGDKISLVNYFAPDHPFDHLDTLIKLAGYTDADIDLDAFAAWDISTNINGWRDYPEDDMNFSAVIAEDAKVSDLIMEIAEMLDARIWVNENSKITIVRNLPNKPGRTYKTITDDGNITLNSDSVDLAMSARLTRCKVFWGLYTLEDREKDTSYQFSDEVIDADAESTAGFDDQLKKTIFSRWINLDCAPTAYPYETEAAQIAWITERVKSYAMRIVQRLREAPSKLDCSVELKDEDVMTGTFVLITTDIIQNPDGTGLTSHPFMVVRRDPDPDGGKVKLKLQKMPARRVGFIAPAAAPDYPSADNADKQYGYISDSSNLMADGITGYFIY
jgi:hypothetical protein